MITAPVGREIVTLMSHAPLSVGVCDEGARPGVHSREPGASWLIPGGVPRFGTPLAHRARTVARRHRLSAPPPATGRNAPPAPPLERAKARRSARSSKTHAEPRCLLGAATPRSAQRSEEHTS